MSTATESARRIWRRCYRLWRKTSAGGAKFAQDLIFPPRCARCDVDLADLAGDVMLCETCADLLGPEEWIGCRCCGQRSPAELPRPASCAWCKSMQLRMDQAIVLGAYQDALREEVLRLKRVAGEPVAAVLAELLWQRRKRCLREMNTDLVVPVPMHWIRRITRGVNSPDVLAARLAKKLRVPVGERLLVRCRNTLPQADLPPSRRFRNVQGAFRLRAGYDLRGARVLLVDDILTTGATASEIARVLKTAGASMVGVAVLARAGGARLTRQSEADRLP